MTLIKTWILWKHISRCVCQLPHKYRCTEVPSHIGTLELTNNPELTLSSMFQVICSVRLELMSWRGDKKVMWSLIHVLVNNMHTISDFIRFVCQDIFQRMHKSHCVIEKHFSKSSRIAIQLGFLFASDQLWANTATRNIKEKNQLESSYKWKTIGEKLTDTSLSTINL